MSTQRLHYAVLGSGGMGVQYGVLLQELAGAKVDFIDTWEPNLAAVREQGGFYISQDGEDRHLVKTNIYTPENYDGDPDVWIIFVKQMQLDDFLTRSAHLFKSHQYVFSAMNGYGHFEKINEYFPAHHIIGGTALIGAGVYGPGDINFTGAPDAKAMNMCAFDESAGSSTETAIFDDFTAASLNPTIVTNFWGMCMAKIVFNSVLNTLCTMYQIRFGEFIADDGAVPMAKQLIDEAYSAAEAAGRKLLGTRESELATIVNIARNLHPLHYPSMYQDLTKGRPTEVDYINGYIARIGRDAGFVCPTHEFVTREVHLAERAFRIHHPEFAEAE